MTLTNKDSKILYFSKKSQVPFIICPKTNSDWSRDRVVKFQWQYNGIDIQLEYTIQIFVKQLFDITKEELEIWNNVDSGNVSGPEISSEYIFEIIVSDSKKCLDINLNNLTLKNGQTISLQNGAYRWRIKTKGTISSSYSDWANDGIVRLDSDSPKIINASAVCRSISENSDLSKMSSLISDMSMPYLITRREDDSGYDRHIDRKGKSYFYITYDYRDHSIVLRTQSGSSTKKQRFYGFISFHKPIENQVEPSPDFTIQDSIKAAYLYTINKGESDGPFYETNISNSSDGKLENILTLEGVNDSLHKIFRPRGFPTFLQGDIFNFYGIDMNKPATIRNSDEISFFSTFPIHSQFVKKRILNFNFIDSSIYSEYSVFENFIEFRYCSPLESIFIYVKNDFSKILAYGQYSKDSVNKICLNNNTNDVLDVIRGLDLSINNASYDNIIKKMDNDNNNKYEIFHSSNIESLLGGIFTYGNTGNEFPIVPRSNYFFFNLVSSFDSDRDSGLKIYLNTEIYSQIYESNPTEKQILDSFEIYMMPDTDCSLCYSGKSLEYSEDRDDLFYKQPIPIDNIGIGRAKISPMNLPMYSVTPSVEGGSLPKRFYKYIKYANKNVEESYYFEVNKILSTTEWLADEKYFKNIESENNILFNGSFRIKIPEYKWASYYHPTAVYYIDNSDRSSIPHILDADPNRGKVDNIINWDSIEIRSSSCRFFDQNNLMKFEYFYGSDFAKLEGTSQYYGQANPYFYNHLGIQNYDFNTGEVLRLHGSLLPPGDTVSNSVKHFGWMTGLYGMGDLAYTLYNRGWSHDGIWYNFIDRGFYGLADCDPDFEYVKGSLQVFLNGQLLINENGIVDGQSMIPTYKENLKNLHEFEFVNVGKGGLERPPDENDSISILFRAKKYNETLPTIGPFYLLGDGQSNDFSFTNFDGSLEPFLQGSLLVFLNGMLLTKNIDYVEKETCDGFIFLENDNFAGIPNSNDLISVVYKQKDEIVSNKICGPYFVAAKSGMDQSYDLQNDFGLDPNEIFEEDSLQVYFNGFLLDSRTEYTEGSEFKTFSLLIQATDNDIIGIVYKITESSDEELVGPIFIQPKSMDLRYSVRGYWSVDSKIKTKIRFREFSNHLFRKSIKVLIDNNDSPRMYDDDLFVEKDYTSWIRPIGTTIENEETFIFNGGMSSVLNTSLFENTPSWIMYNETDLVSKLEVFIDNLAALDYSSQGLFSPDGDSADTKWTLSNKNIFAGYFLISNDKTEKEIYNQIKRTINDKPKQNKTLTIFGPLRSESKIIETEESLISGDIFSIGNIFGVTYLESGKIKVLINIESNVSGVFGIKTFVTNLDIGKSEDEQKSRYYWGAGNENGITQPTSILMQKINNINIDYSDPLTISQSALLFKTARTPISFIEWYFKNRILSWTNINDFVDEDSIKDRVQYGSSKIEFNVEIGENNKGYKLIYLQIMDKVGNISNIYCVPIYVSGSDEKNVEKIENVIVNVGEDFPVETSEIVYDESTSYIFDSGLNVRDSDEFRSITFRGLLSKSNGFFVDYEKPDTLLLGLSDNYGLSYNVFAPYSSVRNWRFDRPISIPMKSRAENKGAEWYFDPNDIRHYSVDSEFDYIKGFGYNNNSSTSKNNIKSSNFNFHIPSNGTLQPITLIGFRSDIIDPTNEDTFGKGNPIADKIYKNRDELIGKKIKIGCLRSESFDILHIFKSSFLSEVKKYNSVSDDPYRVIDGDFSGIVKVWIVISDPDAICAMILSRKFQYINTIYDFVDSERYNFIRHDTGTAKSLGLNWYDSTRSYMGNSNPNTEIFETNDFGYYVSEDLIPETINDVVNSALNMNGNICDLNNPSSFYDASIGEDFIYIVPSEVTDKTSGLLTGEGWIAQIFHAYDMSVGYDQSPNSILNSFDLYHNQLLGITVYNKMVFGDIVNIKCKILSIVERDIANADGSVESCFCVILSNNGRVDKTMIGLRFSLIDSSNSLLLTGTIIDVNSSINRDTEGAGSVLIIDKSPPSVDWTAEDYFISIDIMPLQSIDLLTNEVYSQGWFPSIDGYFVPYIGRPLGSVNDSLKDDVQSKTKYAVIIRGGIYISEEGEYEFFIQKNKGAYAELSLDFMDAESIVSDLLNSNINIGGKVIAINNESFSSNLTTDYIKFFLKKGWHTVRIKYVSERDAILKPKQILNLQYSRPGWGDMKVPIIGSGTEKYNFLSKGYRTVVAKLIDQNNNVFPDLLSLNSSVNLSQSKNELRAVLGFYESLSGSVSGRIKNQIVSVRRVDDQEYGEIDTRTRKDSEINGTFGGQILEEVYGVYESSVIDGGSNFRFWRTISWTTNNPLPIDTSVEFYIRTASTEEDLLEKQYNQTGDNGQIIKPIVISGTDIISFSQQSISVADSTNIFRFLQYKMVLRSRNRGETPVVKDVTISYSKLNSVNFFTTTFDLNSNIIRAVLSYNGETPVDVNGVALSDIQFGICTKEISDGVVSTNFDDYEIIPVDESFSLSDLGINAAPNDKFRIGIKFISTEKSVPFVDDFAIMWETDGKSNRVKDFLS